ncbi:MAG: triose-phosphate isomerase [Polyangiales bacterium]
MTAVLRRPLVAGNWKLHKNENEARALIAALRARLNDIGGVDVVVAPVFTALSTVREALTGSSIRLGAQDVYWQAQGAFTGEVSAPLLKDVGCSHVIVGHSERRQLFSETNEDVRRKAAAVLAAGMTPIVCVGESLSQRENGETKAHVLRQVGDAVSGLGPDQMARLVLAYEPIWAIGTGRNAEPADAQQVHADIRGLLKERFGAPLAGATRILYGGSVKPDNARALMAQTEVDGALVGGASLDSDSFAAIVDAARHAGTP